MLKRLILMILFLGAAIGGIYGWKSFQAEVMKKAVAAYVPPPATVATAKAKQVTWTRYLRAVGTLQADQRITLSPEVSARIQGVNFESGQRVSAGTLIFQLDDSLEQAQLLGAKADLELAKASYERDLELKKKKAVATTQVDTVRAQRDVAAAEVDRIEDLIDQKKIKAPFDGKLGLRNIEVGEYVAAGEDLVELHSIEYAKLRFTVPERYVASVKPGQEVEITLDAYPGETFRGQVSALAIDVATDTRALEVEARFSNRDGKLLAGMFASTRVILGEQSGIVAVPESAIVYSLYGDTVFLVDKGSGKETKPTVSRKTVVTGDRRGGMVEVRSGIQAGEEVVVAGQGKLSNGVPIKIDNSVVPAPSGEGAG